MAEKFWPQYAYDYMEQALIHRNLVPRMKVRKVAEQALFHAYMATMRNEPYGATTFAELTESNIKLKEHISDLKDKLTELLLENYNKSKDLERVCEKVETLEQKLTDAEQLAVARDEEMRQASKTLRNDLRTIEGLKNRLREAGLEA